MEIALLLHVMGSIDHVVIESIVKISAGKLVNISMRIMTNAHIVEMRR